MNILVTGGRGYVGSHISKCLVHRGFSVFVVDSLFRASPILHPYGEFLQCDVRDTPAIEEIIRRNNIDCVVNCAALAYVEESFHYPENYWHNNVGGLASILQAMRSTGCKRIIQSSTCAVYGNGIGRPFVESDPLLSTNVYGETKAACEALLRESEAAWEIRSLIFRYFNVIGASPDCEIGEDHDPETHLLPLLLRAIMNGGTFYVNGLDFDTPDGTAIRDYLDVMDLAEAHHLGLRYLEKGGTSIALNLGSGKPRSVMEMVRLAEKVTGKTCKVEFRERRIGDPARLAADISLAKATLGWEPSVPISESIQRVVARELR